MHVVLLGPYPPYRGGIAHFAVSLARELRAKGHTVTPITFSRQYPGILFPGRSEFEPEESGEVADRLLDSLDPRSWIRTGRRIRHGQADAVVYSYWLPFFAPGYGMARRVAGKVMRHVALVHNALPHEGRPGDTMLTRRFLRGCDGALVLSESVESDVRRLAPSIPVVRVEHPAYDLFGEAPTRADSRESLGLPADAEVGLFFGFVRPYKGLEVLLRAMPDVVRARPRFRLIVAGEFYEPKEPYERLLDELGIRNRVEVVDAYIPGDAVGRYFAAADVVIQPYTSATQSGVAQVAWQFGRPLIVTDVGGLAETVPHEVAGLVVPPGDAAALAGAIIRYFAENLEPRLSEGARARREKHGWAPLVGALESLLKKSD
ncbi:MAG TPA: glycosyltransferase [Rhodothermales bacterium]